MNSKILFNSLELDKKKYEFKINKFYFLVNVGELMEILCILKEKKKLFFEGNIIINIIDNIFKIEGVYYQEKLVQNIVKNQIYEYEVNFSESFFGELIFDNFRFISKVKVKLVNIVENILIYKI